MFKGVFGKVVSILLAFQLHAGYGIALAGGRSVLGEILVSSQASIAGVAVPETGTILDEDVLRTAKGGRALVRLLPRSRAALAEESEVRFRSVQGQPVAEILSGTVVAQAQGEEAVILQTPSYKVAPAETGKTIYLMALLPDKSTVVAARDGRVSITETSSGKSYVLPEGKFAAIPASATGVPASPGQEREDSRQAPGQQAPPAPSKPPPPPWHIGTLSHGASVALVGAVVAGGLAAAALPFAFGEKAPVSPIQ